VKRTSQQLRANQLQIKTHYLANTTVTVAYPIHQTMYGHLPDVCRPILPSSTNNDATILREVQH
jgi:hypothetical protein